VDLTGTFDALHKANMILIPNPKLKLNVKSVSLLPNPNQFHGALCTLEWRSLPDPDLSKWSLGSLPIDLISQTLQKQYC